MTKPVGKPLIGKTITKTAMEDRGYEHLLAPDHKLMFHSAVNNNTKIQLNNDLKRFSQQLDCDVIHVPKNWIENKAFNRRELHTTFLPAYQAFNRRQLHTTFLPAYQATR
jgi:hypothetical protein